MTMYRYMVLLWSREHDTASKTANYIASSLTQASPHTWRKAWETPGITVLDSGEHKGRMQTYRLTGNSGAILGRLFNNDYTSVTNDLDETETTACLKTKGQHLIDNYWGRYVAFIHDQRRGAHYIMRDPSGAFPCFYTQFQNVEIYFSDMQDAADLDFLHFTVNWDYLKTNLALPQYQKIHTGLNEVSEVLPAECVEITPFNREKRFVWNPTTISKTNIVENTEDATELLRSTVKNTIGALAGCYDRVVHNLGGLDSSIVLSCLADAPNRPEIMSINYYTASPRGDERIYSREVASKFNVPLVEMELDYRKADISKIFRANKLASPLGMFDCVGLTGGVLEVAKENEAQALFYGVGGDNVFYQPPFNLGALDYVRSHGLFGKDILKIWMEASRYGRKSLYSTFKSMLKERFAPEPCYTHLHNLIFSDIKRPLINQDFLDDNDRLEEFLHPLLIPEDNDLKGKYLHILMTSLFSIEYYDHWDTNYYAERLHAYLTQPIIEACLRIPTWTMTYGGVERGLARKAFQYDFPSNIVRRYTKSTPEEYYNDIYRNNIDYMREVLMDGILVHENILIRDKLEKVFSNSDLFLRFMPYEILSYVGLEAWLQEWLKRPVKQTNILDIAV